MAVHTCLQVGSQLAQLSRLKEEQTLDQLLFIERL